MTNEWNTDPTQPGPVYLLSYCFTIMPLSWGYVIQRLLQFLKSAMLSHASKLLHGSLLPTLLSLTSTAFLSSPENHP